MQDPLKASTMNDFRNALGINTSPSFYETTPITPVAIIGGNLGLPKPKSNQRLRYTTINAGGTNTEFQVATPTSTTTISYLGFSVSNFAAFSGSFVVYDGSSGTYPTLSANTSYPDDLGVLSLFVFPATVGYNFNLFQTLPAKVKKGLRINAGGASQSFIIVVWYLEEDIIN